MVSAHGATHPGAVRRQNEDGLVVDETFGLYAVADGMGGHNAGEVASTLALDSLRGFIARSIQNPDHTWPFGIESSLNFSGNRLRTGIKLANRRVFRESESRNEYTGMGTTIAAVLLDGGCAVLCGVGDSRIYLVRQQTVECLTQDHTWVELLLSQNPGLSRDAVANHPMRHVLTTVIGAQDDVDVTIGSRPVVPGDRLVLCTDGVHAALDDERIGRIVGAAADVRSAADTLIEDALRADGSDNLTAIVVDITS